jgi:hypothetical protein
MGSGSAARQGKAGGQLCSGQPRLRLALARLAAASSSLAAVAGCTDGDELLQRRGLPVRAQARAWAVEKGEGPGEVGAAAGTRNQRTAWWLRWICGRRRCCS